MAADRGTLRKRVRRTAALRLATVLAAGLAGCPPAAVESSEGPYKPEQELYAVGQQAGTWYDVQRLREIPYQIYTPQAQAGAGPFPVIVFSHGLGSSGGHYAYLGRQWAGRGYVVVFVDHPGTDAQSLTENGSWLSVVLQAIAEISHRLNRPRDISFALDRLAEDPVVQAVADMDRVGAAGHSFGAYTVLALIGMKLNLPGDPGAQLADGRVQAVVAMSPPGIGALDLQADAWDELDRPCMTMMGTLDVDPETLTVAGRRAPFERSPGPDQYLVTLQYATHGAFDERSELLVDVIGHRRHRWSIETVTTAFFDAYLKGDAVAQEWLLSGELTRLSGGYCEVEYKHVMPLAADE